MGHEQNRLKHSISIFLRYSDEIWDTSSNTKLDHLQRLQTRALTLIVGYRLKDGSSCNWLSVSNLMIFDRAMMIYVSVFFQLGKRCPFEKSENQFFCPKKINFDFNGRYLWTKTGLVTL